LSIRTEVATPKTAAHSRRGVSVFRELLRKIRASTARVAVIGLGHVGLPTAVVFASAGYEVVGVDAKEELVQAIGSSRIPFDEPGIKERLTMALNTGKLQLTTDVANGTRLADIIIVCVQTPVTESREPDLSYLRNACELLGSGLSPGRLVVIESTVPPGATDGLVAKILEKQSGLKCGTDFWLAHCPERLAPGNGIDDFTRTTRVVGGVDAKSSRAATDLFKRVTQGDVIGTGSASAEVAKLAENTFRSVNIAFANELALLCEGIGVDVAEVIRLANSHPRVNIHNPGPGVGGPCIPKDPNLLIYAAKKEGVSLDVVCAARLVNEGMPAHVSELVLRALEHVGNQNGRPKVCVLGTAYKAGISSAWYSPAEKVIKEVAKRSVDVVVYDPYCDETFGALKAHSLHDAVRGADCVVLLTDHDEFRRLDLPALRRLMNRHAVIVDTRRMLNPAQVRGSGIPYIGVGFGCVDPAEGSTDREHPLPDGRSIRSRV
jgi:UDP-N-acetyl-D-mannosaminuronic acid dehydrogenase